MPDIFARSADPERRKSLTSGGGGGDGGGVGVSCPVAVDWVHPNPAYSYAGTGYRTWGRDVWWFWPVASLIPIAFLYTWLSIPLGDPSSQKSKDWAPFVFAFNPLLSCVLGYYHMVTFLFAMNVDRPFRTTVIPLVFIAALSMGVGILLWEEPYIDKPPQFFGAANLLVIMVIVSFTSLLSELIYVSYEDRCRFRRQYKAFLWVQCVYFTYFACMCVYLVAWKYGTCFLQRLLPIILTFVTFLYRKALLTITTPIELEAAMLLSGFSIESMEDMFQVLAFPSVRNPTSFLIIFVVPALMNLGNLVFLTMPWFEFRIWIKDFLKRVFCCVFCREVEEAEWPRPVKDWSDEPDDRGQSPNVMGYHRRQIRFLIWKLLSQLTSFIFYLLVAPYLRFGPNKDMFPFAKDNLGAERFRYSLIFSGGNIIVVVGTLFFARRLVRRWRPEAYSQVSANLTMFSMSRKHIGWALFTVVHNAAIGIAVVCHPYAVYYGFDEPPPLEPCE